MLFFLLAGLLYAWGSPAWFTRFPYSAGLRFLLALEAYFLCCVFFFFLRLAFSKDKMKYAFARFFCLSFAVIPIFSALVILGCKVQILRAFVHGLDVVVWLSIVILGFRKFRGDRSIVPAVFLLSGLLFFFPAIPSIILIVARFLFFAIFFARSFQASQSRQAGFPVRDPADLREVAERFSLSSRETEILALLAAGKTNNEIAETLFISLSTVKTHIAAIYGKMGARNRLEASSLCKKP